MGDRGQASLFWFLMAFAQIYLGVFALDPTYKFLQVLLQGSGYAFLIPAIYFLVVRIRTDEFDRFDGRYNQSERSIIYRDKEGSLAEYHPTKESGNGWVKWAIGGWFLFLIVGGLLV
tara:strand:- start:149 stop:499 length:351 start_codon:yes stop_codon:yes gene_type:complete